MISSTNFFIKVSLIFWLLLVSGSGGSADDRPTGEPRRVSTPTIAVWPVHNLSAGPAPLEDMHRSLLERLRKRSVAMLDEAQLQRFITRVRLRYAGGIDRQTARRLRSDTGADQVLITVLEHYNTIAPPKVSLNARLVALEDPPRIVWMKGVGLAGDDAPGLLELNLIEDPQILVFRALDRLTASLAAYLSDSPDPETEPEARARFGPGVTFTPALLSPTQKYTLAVIPFFNHSYRKHAGDIISLHFVRSLRRVENFRLIEPGVARHSLLRSRIVMDDGLSLADADAVFSRLHADLILVGQVFDYENAQGRSGAPRVGFSARCIERRSREVVWLTRSDHVGDDGVWFFDWGKVNTAHALAAEMVSLAVDTITD